MRNLTRKIYMQAAKSETEESKESWQEFGTTFVIQQFLQNDVKLAVFGNVDLYKEFQELKSIQQKA